jgi:hypothetical protein
MNGMINCLCETHKILKAIEARIYTEEHLIKVSVDDDTGEVIYRCPDTGLLWHTRDPWSWLPGWGPKTLVQVKEC